MRAFTILAALGLAAHSAQAYITTSTEWGSLCYAEVTAPVATQTEAGVTVTATEPGTKYTTSTVYVIYTPPPSKRGYPPAARAVVPSVADQTTIVVVDECITTTTETYTPTTVVYNPSSTTTTSVSSTTVTDITTYTLCAPGNSCL
ncbi:hypothetical protein DL93DRAFT_2230077 [Clavulina sp. PMI_390]|nr:hypothetical protein DL93DRAFT_2230077 [Clavulina sp. PMI_390]